MHLRNTIKTVNTHIQKENLAQCHLEIVAALQRTLLGNGHVVCGSAKDSLCSEVTSGSDYLEFASNHPQAVHKQTGCKLVGTSDLLVTLLLPRGTVEAAMNLSL